MDLINEEHVTGIEIGKQSGEIPRFFDRGSRGDPYLRTHGIGNDARQRCFTESGRAVEKNMIERLASF